MDFPPKSPACIGRTSKRPDSNAVDHRRSVSLVVSSWSHRGCGGETILEWTLIVFGVLASDRFLRSDTEEPVAEIEQAKVVKAKSWIQSPIGEKMADSTFEISPRKIGLAANRWQ